jgi:hypothetical protein
VPDCCALCINIDGILGLTIKAEPIEGQGKCKPPAAKAVIAAFHDESADRLRHRDTAGEAWRERVGFAKQAQTYRCQ